MTAAGYPSPIWQLHVLAEQERETAHQDPLTGLPNLRGFEAHLTLAIARATRASHPLCIGYVDLDNFKRVNDLQGHAAGNQVLQRLGQVLRETVRGQDVVARIGGDEFALVLDAPGVEQVKKMGQRLVDAVAAVGREVPAARLGASVGLVIVDHAAKWSGLEGQLLQQADGAMYEAKQAGKGRLVVIEVQDPPNPQSNSTRNAW